MRTKILKKGSSSRALAFFLPLFMASLSHIFNPSSCLAMETETEGENRPLLKGVIIPINGDQEQGEDQSEDFQVQKLPEINLPKNYESLKQEPNSKDAVAAMQNINTGLYYADIVDVEDEDEKEKIFKNAQLEGICSNKENLGEVIIGRARDAADENGPVQVYFRGNKAQITGLIEIVEQFEKQEKDLKKIILDERKAFYRENEKNRLKYKDLTTTKNILIVCIPVTFILTGAGVWALTWYLGGR